MESVAMAGLPGRPTGKRKRRKKKPLGRTSSGSMKAAASKGLQGAASHGSNSRSEPPVRAPCPETSRLVTTGVRCHPKTRGASRTTQLVALCGDSGSARTSSGGVV